MPPKSANTTTFINPPPRVEAASYGSDPTGLIFGYRFSPDSDPCPVDCAAADSWLAANRNSDKREFIWLHFNRSNVNSGKWLREHVSLPEHYFEVLRDSSSFTRVELQGDYLIAVINDVSHDFSYDASQIATLWMCISSNLVISTRVCPLRSVDRLRLAVKTGEQFRSPISLLAHLLRDQAEVLVQIQRETASRVDQIEDGLLVGRLTTKRSTLGSLRRVFARLRRFLAPEPRAISYLLNHTPAWFTTSDVLELRSSTEEFSAALSDLSALQERIKLLQEELVSHTTEQTNRSIFLLTIVTVIALPINIIAGLLGMNVGGIPLAQDRNGFWIIAVIVALFMVVAGWFAFFKQRD